MEHMETPDIEDIVLVSIPLNSSRDIFFAWQKAGSPPGGPDALWDEELKHTIFFEILKGFFSPSEIEQQWQLMKASLPAAQKQPAPLAG